MRKFLCKVFRFLLGLVKQLVDLVADTLVYVGKAAVEVLSDVASSVGGAILKNPLVLGVIGVGLYLMFARKDDDEDVPRSGNKPSQTNGLVGI